MNDNTKELLIELEEILKANSLITFISVSEKIEPLASEQNDVAVYTTLTNSIPKLNTSGPGLDDYNIHSFFMLTLNVDCTKDKYKIYDVVDSIHRSILNDTGIWLKVIDRDIINTEFDNAEFFPKRSAMIALEVVHRMVCT